LLTLAYGKKIGALRSKYRGYLWDAEFHDTLGAKVTFPDGSPRHSVFVTSSGKRAFVVVNLEQNKAIGVTVDLPNPGKLALSPRSAWADPRGESRTVARTGRRTFDENRSPGFSSVQEAQTLSPLTVRLSE